MATTPTSYTYASAYYGTPTFDNGKFLDLLNYRAIPKLVEDVLFTIPPQYEYRPDLLAADLYGDPTLWWVFAVRNKDVLRDPVYDFVPGQVIYLPQQQSIRQALGN